MIGSIQNYIGGEWVDVAGSESVPVHNPATCELLGFLS